MPKSRKQKTSVRKKKKPSPRKKIPIASKKRDNEPLLESTAEQAVPNTVAVGSNVGASQTSSVGIGIEEDALRIEDFADVSEERASIISIVKGLEGQVETAFRLKEVLETELDTAQKRLSEELDARTQLEIQVESLEARATLAEQLREDISFAEEERNKFANLLAQTQTQLEEVTVERDSLTEQVVSTEAHDKEIEGEKMALEAQVMNLKDKITDADRLRKELTEVTEAHRDLREQVHGLTRRLETSETSKNVTERELDGAHQTSRSLREEVEELRRKIAGADSRIIDMRIQLEDQQAANKELIESKTRLESEMRMLNINYEAVKKELDAFKNALRDIRSEATQTSGRVRQRYFKPNSVTIQSKK